MKRILLTVAGTIVLALVYLGVVFVTRYKADREMERAWRAREAAKYKRSTLSVGTGVRILQFYASSGEIARGEHATVCYGVENTRAVRLDPAIEQLEPSLNRCFSVSPRQTTTFKLTATGQDGCEVSESFTLRVGPAPPRIVSVDLSSAGVKRGEPFTMCFLVENASSVRVEPLGWSMPASSKRTCRTWIPPRTMKYTLTASSADGRKDQEAFTVKVE
jgi:hypothetical protein